MKEQVEKYLSGNEAAALAVKQIGYDIMGYYPITPCLLYTSPSPRDA